MRASPTYKITPTTPGLVKLTFDAEVGGRTIVVHRKRQLKPSEAELIVRIDRWSAPPGSVMELEGWGVADGKWLVESVGRGLFHAEAKIHLRAPQAPLPEPAAIGASVKGGGSSAGASAKGGAAAIVAAARKAIAEVHNYEYHEERPMPSSLFGPAPRRMDCSAYATLCYKAAGAPDPNGYGYNGRGNTGSLLAAGQRVTVAGAADLVFYNPPGVPQVGGAGHVAVALGGGMIANMGRPGEPVEESIEAPGKPIAICRYKL